MHSPSDHPNLRGRCRAFFERSCLADRVSARETREDDGQDVMHDINVLTPTPTAQSCRGHRRCCTESQTKTRYCTRGSARPAAPRQPSDGPRRLRCAMLACASFFFPFLSLRSTATTPTAAFPHAPESGQIHLMQRMLLGLVAWADLALASSFFPANPTPRTLFTSIRQSQHSSKVERCSLT